MGEDALVEMHTESMLELWTPPCKNSWFRTSRINMLISEMVALGGAEYLQFVTFNKIRG
jgi:hypothetical protein